MKLKSKKKAELIRMLEAAKPDLYIFGLEKLSWLGLPFNPEDLGFKEYLQEDNEHGMMRIYIRGEVTCMRIDSESNWVVKTKESKMTFKIKSKFHAFQLFKMLGLDIDPSSSSVPDLDTPIGEILAKGKSEEE